MRNAKIIKATPLIHEKLCFDFFAKDSPRKPPTLIANMPIIKEVKITENILISVNAAPKPAARLSNDKAMANEIDSTGEISCEAHQTSIVHQYISDKL